MNDNYLIRSFGDDDGHNLAVGEPYIVQDGFEQIINAVDPLTNWEYPQLGGDDGLIKQIQNRWGHLYGSIPYVVVANGAKQALLASLYALNKTKRFSALSHRLPYWVSYPTLAQLSNLHFGGEEQDNKITINTSPNNPDGSWDEQKCDIWDAAYYSPFYMSSDAKQNIPSHRISVWSAAKQFGMSGLRIGWLITCNRELAEDAAKYVEITTSGVSTMAQGHLTGVLRELNRKTRINRSIDEKIAESLDKNRELFRKLIGPHCQTVSGLESGMFAFFLPTNTREFDSALKKSKVRLVPGEACGAPGWWRMSLGNRYRATKLALETLAGELE